ncbi:MAG: zinc-binding dehydrogenase, partial [Acidobacteriaceae bacterium]
VEVGGAGTLKESMKAVRIGGSIAQIGVLSSSEERFEVTSVLMRQLRLIGVYVGSHTMMQAMNRAIELSHMQPVVGKVFPILETIGAYRYLEQARHFAKVIISLTSEK